MKILTAVFSGTGHTLKVCKRFQQEFERYGIQNDIFGIRKDTVIPNVADYDTLIIGYPVHGFNAPTPVKEYVESLPNAQGEMNVYFVKSSGEPLKLNDSSGLQCVKILKKKGYRICGETHIIMPYNIIFRHSDGMAARMWQVAELKIPKEAEMIANGVVTPMPFKGYSNAVARIVRIEHAAMPFIGKTFRVKKKTCIGCGKCEKLCPMGNIAMQDGKPKFSNQCVGCMACAFGCPKDAINTGILNSWRVNGKYRYDAVPAKDEEICFYCRKSYKKYFHSAEDVVE